MNPLDRQSPARRALLTALKAAGTATATELGLATAVTAEAARQQLKLLEAEGLVALSRRATGAQGGRPAHGYALTATGENLFPKRYDDLAVLLIDAIGSRLGPTASREVLSAVVEARVAALRPKLAGLATDEARLEALRQIYVADDPWLDVGTDGTSPLLIEKNCPFLDVAVRRPALCSTTVHTLSRLLGRRVVRTHTFQAGDGRCVFRVTDEPVAEEAPFTLESDP